MSAPSFSNIELWLFELAEGNLSKDQIEQLELFIMQHPELDLERDMWEVAKVDASPVVFPDAKNLEKRRRGVGIYAGSAILATLFIGFFGYSYVTTGGLFTFFSPSNELQSNTTEQQEREIIQRIHELNDGFVSNGTAAQSGHFGTWRTERFANEWHARNMMPSTVSNPVSSERVPVVLGNQFQDRESQTLAQGNEIPVGVTVSRRESRFNELLNLQQEKSIAAQIWDEATPEIDDKGEFVSEPRTVDSYQKDLKNDIRSTTAATKSGVSTSVKRNGFKIKLNRFARSIQRMMDNPVALKNSRDPHYHVPGLTTNDINFSAAGTLLATRVQTLSRAQWLGKENEQFINQVSVDGYSYGMRGGWGIQMNHSMYKDGGLHVGQIAMTYSPKISITNSVSFEPSLRFKMGDKHLSASQMDGVEMVEVERGNAIDYYKEGQTPIGRNLWYKDLGAGALVNTKWFFVGARIDNIFRYTDNIFSYDIKNPRRAACDFVASAGTDWLNQRRTLGLSPYLVYRNNDQLSELWGGANIRWNWMTAGVAVNNKLDPAASIGVKSKRFSINYNIDYTTSAMTEERALSHQVSLRFVTKQNRFGQR